MLRILLVEDSDADVVLIREGFRRSGIAADVQFAQNSEQALRLLTHSIKPDFIVVDIHLPKLDALTVLNHCRSIDGAPPVILMTGSGDDCESWRAMKLGALDYIAKPTSFAGRVDMLNDVIERWNVTIVSSAAKRRQRSSRERPCIPVAGFNKAWLVAIHPLLRQNVKNDL